MHLPLSSAAHTSFVSAMGIGGVVARQLLPTQNIRVQIRCDASRPVTKQRIRTATAGGTHNTLPGS